MSSFWKWSIKTTSSLEKWSPSQSKIQIILALQSATTELTPPLLHSFVVEGVSILWLHLVMQEFAKTKKSLVFSTRGRDHFPKDDVVFIDHFQKDDIWRFGQTDHQKITIFGRRSLWTLPKHIICLNMAKRSLKMCWYYRGSIVVKFTIRQKIWQNVP